MIPSKPEVWWQIDGGLAPRTVRVVRYTKDSVWLEHGTRPVKRRTDWGIYAPTRLECLEFLLQKQEEYLAEQQQSVEYHQKAVKSAANNIAHYKAAVAKEKANPTAPKEPDEKPWEDMV